MKIINSLKYLLLFLIIFLIPSPFVMAKESLEIEDVRIVEQSGTINIDEITFNNNTINTPIEFKNINDFIVLEIKIKNNTSNDYEFQSVTNTFEGDNISIYSPTVGKKINQGSIEYIQVKLQYNKELYNQDKNNNSQIILHFKNETQLKNPLTVNNNILIIIIVLLLIILNIHIIKNEKASIVVLLLLLSPIIINAEDDYKLTLNIDNFSIKGRFLSYRVTVKNDNSIIETYNKIYGESIEELPDYDQKEGYTCDGWVDQNNHIMQNNSIVEGDLIIEPNYVPIQYNISYNLNGGTVNKSNPTTYNIEDEIVLNNPTKQGYNFSGWIEDGTGLLQTDVVIYPGNMGDKLYTASYTPDPNTLYTIEHYKMNVNGVYEKIETEEKHGTTGSKISPQPKEFDGFITPQIQTVQISGDGKTKISYYYERKKFLFKLNNREFINGTIADGYYYYGTNINIELQTKAGYTVLWNDNSTEYHREFSLEQDIELTPTYIPRDDTKYTIIYEQMNLDGQTYSVKERLEFEGTTDTIVTSMPNIYEGFETPAAQDILITGDGSATLTYRYKRKKYTLTLEGEEYIETSFQSKQYYYGTEITLKAKTREGKVFVKWSNGSENEELKFTITNDILIYPIYDNNSYDFEYTGDEQVLTIPQTGYYKLEIWGAQGGSIPSYHGGYGGYSKGIIMLHKNDKLYINVGGAGTGATTSGQTIAGGYNGGGKVIGYGAVNHINASGGGATHIAISSGLIQEFENKREDLIMVAGGGGGARDQSNHWTNARWGHGGSGGGASSSAAYSNRDTYTVTQQNTCIATQTIGLAFGKSPDISGNSAGGGGYICGFHGGGYSNTTSCTYLGTGSGGSGYIGYTNLINKHMTCFNCTPSFNNDEFSVSSICHSSDAISDCSKEGPGYAMISYVGIDEIDSNNLLILDNTITMKKGTTENLIRDIHVLEDMTFTSNNEEVATINESGLITALSEGTTNISLKYNGHEIVYKINVIL